MHGQSNYTHTKQEHLSGLLNICTHAWNPLVNGKPTWAHPEVVIIDCTSGNGHTEQGDEGSPLLINAWAQRSYGFGFRQLCCERTPTSFVKLTQNNLSQTDIMLGSYQELVPIWLESLDLKRPALGFVYCDPNGAKDLIEGIDLFAWLARQPRFQCLDFIFHWSMNAYSRNAGVGNEWAQTPLLDVVHRLAMMKRHAYMREPLDKWQWVFMQILNTSKVRPIWPNERVLAYADWCRQFAERFTA